MPSALIDGQLVCAGCGSDVISCDRVSLFTNVTLCPTVIEPHDGLIAPLFLMVMVAPLAAGPAPEGVVGVLPPPSPQAIISARLAAADRGFQVRFLVWVTGDAPRRVRRIFSKY